MSVNALRKLTCLENILSNCFRASLDFKAGGIVRSIFYNQLTFVQS
jgi:hypothetical protein